MNMNNDEIRKETFGRFENEEEFQNEKNFTDVEEKRNDNAGNKQSKKSIPAIILKVNSIAH